MNLHADQLHALTLATDGARIAIVTGAPGTGKSTVVRSIVAEFARQELKVILAAPTGKAARRLMEASGAPATTIHRMLGPTRLPSGRFVFSHSRENPIPADVVILDEVSMVDVELAAKVLDALAPHARIILVGDVNQLPAVGPGSVLQDLIAARGIGVGGSLALVPVAELTTIKRQSPGPLLLAIHAIKDGRAPAIDNADPTADLFLVDLDEPAEIARTIVTLALERLPAKLGIDRTSALREIQVIAPMKDKGALSCAALNAMFQAALHPGEAEPLEFDEETGAPVLKGRKRALLVGDKVIQTKNDHALALCNGDIGFVIDPDARDAEGRKVLICEFDALEGGRRRVEIPAGENKLDLAYAITVHKSQGSEFRVLIFPVHSSQSTKLMTRNLVYTAISRARSLCVIVGEERALTAAVRRTSPTKRRTGLRRMVEAGATR